MAKIVLSNGIYKSEKDTRVYSYVQLKNNLNVLLISDKETSSSVACLNVKVGSYEEKTDGLAHFLEHMLFLGSEKYPEENYYNNMISQYNGYSNAYTAGDHTSYYFSSSQNGFAIILDIFAQFFINPSFTSSALKREMKAVDSEHRKNINDDAWRFQQMIKTVAKKSHPYNKFTTGTLETLKIKGIEEQVQQFFKKYYVGEKMLLILMSTDSIEELEALAQKMFSKIPSIPNISNPNISNISSSTKIKFGKIFNTPKLIKMVPIKKKNNLAMVWQIPDSKKYLDDNNMNIVLILSYLLGNEGYGSIFQYLRTENICKKLMAGLYERVDDYLLFSITVTTYKPESMDNIYKIIKIIYIYISLILNDKETLKNIYNEHKLLLDQKLIFYEKEEPRDYVTNLASTWATAEIPIKNILIYNKYMDPFSDKFYNLLESMLTFLNPTNCICVLSSQMYTKKLNNYEKWYDIEYSETKPYTVENGDKTETRPETETKTEIDTENGDETKTETETDETDKTEIDGSKFDIIKYSKLYLPFPNKYIDKNLEIIKESPMKEPIKIENKKSNSNITTWYQYVSIFKNPYAIFTTEIILPTLKKSAKLYLTMSLYIKYVLYLMNPDIYECNNGGYGVNINLTQEYLSITISGPHNNIDKVLKLCVDNILKYMHRNKEKMDTYNTNTKIFNKIKNTLKDGFINSLYISPYEQVVYKLMENIDKTYYSQDILISLIDDIEYEDVSKLENIFDDATVRNLIIGNISKTSSIDLCNLLELFGFKQSKKIEHTNLDLTKNTFTLKSKNPTEINSAMGMFMNIGYLEPMYDKNWATKYCLCDLLDLMLGENYYHDLRTTRQLGYVVKTDKLRIGSLFKKLTVYEFLVQSSIKDSNYLVKVTNKFIKNSLKFVEEMTNEEFQNRKDSVIDQLKKPSDNLAQYVIKMFNRIYVVQDLNFEKILIDTMSTITIQDLVDFYKTYFYNNNKYWIVQIDPGK